MAKGIQRKRTKGWRMPDGAVFVGRRSKWGNPFKWQNAWPEADAKKKEWAARKFDAWLRGDTHQDFEPERRKWILSHLPELAGKDLSCWCGLDDFCHRDILLKLAAEFEPVVQGSFFDAG